MKIIQVKTQKLYIIKKQSNKISDIPRYSLLSEGIPIKLGTNI